MGMSASLYLQAHPMCLAGAVAWPCMVHVHRKHASCMDTAGIQQNKLSGAHRTRFATPVTTDAAMLACPDNMCQRVHTHTQGTPHSLNFHVEEPAHTACLQPYNRLSVPQDTKWQEPRCQSPADPLLNCWVWPGFSLHSCETGEDLQSLLAKQ